MRKKGPPCGLAIRGQAVKRKVNGLQAVIPDFVFEVQVTFSFAASGDVALGYTENQYDPERDGPAVWDALCRVLPSQAIRDFEQNLGAYERHK